jgi:hypothetical protein
MTAILFLTRYITIDHPLFFSRNQFTHPCNGSETEVREDSRRSQGFLSGRALRLIGSAAKSSGGPPRDRQAQLITPAPPQETAPRGPVGLRATAPAPSVGLATRMHAKKAITNDRSRWAQEKTPSPYPAAYPHLKSSASPRDYDQPLSTSGKNRPAIFARPTSGSSLGAAPPPEMNRRLKR